MRTTAVAALLVLLTGCWKLDDPTITYDEVPLDNVWVADDAQVVVRTFEPSPPLECPDGENATFYAVYDQTITTPVPVAIVFHSGAFDYVKNPANDDPLGGVHFADGDRLSRSWAQTRVFSMLGMWDSSVDPSETHTGALVTTLAQRGSLVLLPANCWGDLWHNYSGRQENDYATERFYRDGLALASWMYRFVTDEAFATDHEVSLPVEVDVDHIGLVGLGDGGRAVSELLWLLQDVTYAFEPIEAVVLDSTPDDLAYYRAQTSLYSDINTGIDRVFDERVEDISHHSMAAYLADPSVPEPRTMVIWSNYDPVVPDETLEALVAEVEAREAVDDDSFRVEDVAAPVHVVSNNDQPLADEVERFLFD